MPRNKMGSIVVKLPLPPACLPTLWQADDRMRESYLAEFPGYYKTADAGYIDDDGYVYVMGRTDDIINVAGHRLSTGGMEEVLASHQDVAECAVLGIKDELKGEVPCGFIVLKAGVNRPPTEIEQECVHWCATRSARSRRSSSPSPWRGCRRRARAKSSAAPSRRSPTASLADAGHHRRSGDPRRDRRRDEGEGHRRLGYFVFCLFFVRRRLLLSSRSPRWRPCGYWFRREAGSYQCGCVC